MDIAVDLDKCKQNFSNLNFEIDIKISDFGAYKFPEIQNMLIDYGFVERGGFLYDLSFLRLRERKKGKRLNDELLALLISI